MPIFLAFLLIHFIGFVFYRYLKTTPISSFLIGLFSFITFVYVGGVFGVLFYARLIFVFLVMLLFIYDIYKNRKNYYLKNIVSYFDIYNLLLICFGVLFLIIYNINRPLFSYWDEFSFWGTNAKTLVEANLFSLNTNIIGGSGVITYVFNIFTDSFNEYSLYFAYTIVTLSTFGVAVEFILKRLKSSEKFLAPILFLSFTLSPFLQNNHLPSKDFFYVHYAYGTAMVDYLLAILTFSVVILYLNNKENKLPVYLPAIFVLIITKDVGIFFAILALCIILCFEFFTNFDKKFLFKKVLNLFLCIIVMYTAYMSWDFFISHEFQNYTTPKEVSITTSSLTYEIKEAVPQILNENIPAEKQGNFLFQLINEDYRSSRQNEVINSMFYQLKTSNSAINIKDTTLITLLVFVGLVCIFFQDKKYRLPLFFANLGICVSLIFYILSISLFIANFRDGMIEYSRYVSTFYWAWIYLVFTLLFKTLLSKKVYFPVYILTLITSFLAYNIGLEHTIISSSENNYELSTEIKVNSEKYQYIFDTEPRILLIVDRFNDYHYNISYFYSLPAKLNLDINDTGLDFSKSFSNIDYLTNENETYYIFVSDEEFLNIVFENFDYIYITHPQYEFVSSFSEYFDSEIKEYSLFKVTNDSKSPFEVVTDE